MDALCKKNRQGNMWKPCLELRKNRFFSFMKIKKMKNKSKKVEIWHGAMNWHQNAVVKLEMVWRLLPCRVFTNRAISDEDSSFREGTAYILRDSWGIFFVWTWYSFVWSTYAMKSLQRKFGIFWDLFAIFKRFTAFSLHLMQVIQIWTTST